jgi:DNA polymerase-3 subunit epsilon
MEGAAVKYALILDTETTGLDPSVHRCIEVACILFDLQRAVPVASYASLIRSDANDAEAVNRIPVGALLEAQHDIVVWRHVVELASEVDVILAHRAEFDRSFVLGSLRDFRPWVCTKFHVEWPHGKIGDGLASLALAHGCGVVSAHRAMTDCDILSRLMMRVHETGTPLVPIIERAMRPRRSVVALVSYEERDKAKASGFAWDAEARHWWRDIPCDEIEKLPFRTRPMGP